MAPQRKLPDKSELLMLRRQGWTQKEIADKFGVSESAVWKALSRVGLTGGGMTTKEYLGQFGIRVAPEHRATAVMDRFRSIVKQKKGIPLRPEEEQLLRQWLHDLKTNGLVVDYHPDAPPNPASSKGGFFYKPRTVDDDEFIRRRPRGHADGIIRHPELS